MATNSQAINTSPFYSRELKGFAIKAMLTLFTLVLLIVYLLPFGNMFMLAISGKDQLAQAANDPIFPMKAVTYTYTDGKEYPMYLLPTESGVKTVAMFKKTNAKSTFIDTANPDAGTFEWVGSWRTLEPLKTFMPRLENFPEAWQKANFPRMFRNTLAIAIGGMIGALLSSICVAYAFARFPIPGKNILFIILIGTIILPTQVTLIPTYAFFAAIGWTGTWAPLIVPHFFANAYNVFLLRQYFLTLPRELDEAAMIDGAGPFKILTSVIIPQAWPAIISVSVFHFVFAWNDYFSPLIYLLSAPELQPISVGVQIFNFQYGPEPQLVQATSLMAMVLPLIIFFMAQRVFMRGVVITGVEK